MPKCIYETRQSLPGIYPKTYTLEVICGRKLVKNIPTDEKSVSENNFCTFSDCGKCKHPSVDNKNIAKLNRIVRDQNFERKKVLQNSKREDYSELDCSDSLRDTLFRMVRADPDSSVCHPTYLSLIGFCNYYVERICAELNFNEELIRKILPKEIGFLISEYSDVFSYFFDEENMRKKYPTSMEMNNNV